MPKLCQFFKHLLKCLEMLTGYQWSHWATWRANVKTTGRVSHRGIGETGTKISVLPAAIAKMFAWVELVAVCVMCCFLNISLFCSVGICCVSRHNDHLSTLFMYCCCFSHLAKNTFQSVIFFSFCQDHSSRHVSSFTAIFFSSS